MKQQKFINRAHVRQGTRKGRVVATGPQIFFVMWEDRTKSVMYPWSVVPHLIQLDIPDLCPL